MHVLATAGHVDHGKSALVRALTGREPDRWAEEQRRGLTLDLGFAWTDLPEPGGAQRSGPGERVAFVDVPGHERFVPTMLAGVGPVPAVLLVVAADGGWMPQSQEHLDALDALGVRHGLLVVTRSDLVTPEAARETVAAARARLAGTSLAGVDDVVVSARTGDGTDALRAALVHLVRGLPAADDAAPVRLWLDRSFTIRGAGTVVTGTLATGTLRTGDELEVVDPAGDRRAVRVRGLQSLEEPRESVAAVARVAVNVRGTGTDDVPRGAALLTPGSTRLTREVDVVLTGAVRARQAGDGRRSAAAATDPGSTDGDVRLPGELLLHLGAAQVSARTRPLGTVAAPGTAAPGGQPLELVRLVLRTPLPLRLGDVGLLRDPGRHAVVAGLRVLDVDPPALTRRGAARARAQDLATAARLLAGPHRQGTAHDATTTDRTAADQTAADRTAGLLLEDEVRRRGVVRAADLVAAGHPAEAVARVGASRPWVLDAARAGQLREALARAVAEHAGAEPLTGGMPLEAARHRLDLPSADLVSQLAAGLLDERDGRLAAPAPRRAPVDQLPAPVARGVRALLEDLAREPFRAPDANRLRDLGLGPRELGAAVRVGALERVGDGVVLAPGALDAAAAALADLPSPFTTSEARQAWGTSRRVALPLLAALDGARRTVREPDDRRRLR